MWLSSNFVAFSAFALILLASNYCFSYVIRDKSVLVGESKSFSPYFAAFSEDYKKKMREYERLRQQLMHFKMIDWNVVVLTGIGSDSSSQD
ncbi:CLUMA_CG020604, isoform A [Clunio marinus]|uniref:CLUMA_CG020604, isoform A n=1 Tax=Clunio marinus TaxID=568069 RepID=A0A1J1J5G0_9DIPT|nr:CLUMA_CG020604, isoform A [Clunio marinus]